MRIPNVLSIAGTDPSGGAGIQADIKTISATGSYAASVITILVAQNTQGVQEIYSISPDFVKQQINSVFEDLNISAVKIGMVFSKEIIEIVADAINKFKPKYVVLDPVMCAKDGSLLLDLASLNSLQEILFPLANLITPNLFEVEKIMNQRITSLMNMEHAAKELALKFKTNMLIKGGHLAGKKSSDVLYLYNEKTLHWFHCKKVNTQNTHGTGCTLSSAIASYLAQNYSFTEAINLSKLYLTAAIKAGSQMQIGRGCGPVKHFLT